MIVYNIFYRQCQTPNRLCTFQRACCCILFAIIVFSVHEQRNKLIRKNTIRRFTIRRCCCLVVIFFSIVRSFKNVCEFCVLWYYFQVHTIFIYYKTKTNALRVAKANRFTKEIFKPHMQFIFTKIVILMCGVQFKWMIRRLKVTWISELRIGTSRSILLEHCRHKIKRSQ